MSFPGHRFDHVGDYAGAYFDRLAEAAASVDRDALGRALTLLEDAYEHRRWLYVCGNGGSAAIANHLVCDHMKGAQTDTDLLPRVTSLSSNIELITAVANDISYDDVFVYQLSTLAHTDDVLLTVSSSGNSENVVRACEWARNNGLRTIAMTGFDGGRTAELAEVTLHVDAHNYGIVEDVHQSLMHVLAQYIRLARMPDDLIAERSF